MDSLSWLLNDFLTYYPSFKNEIVDYYSTDGNELILKMTNNDVIMYDSIDSTIRVLPSDADHMKDEEWRNEFINRFNKIIRRKGMTQTELAEASGISRKQINFYSNGRSIPSLHAIDKIAKALDCNIEDFIYRDKHE